MSTVYEKYEKVTNRLSKNIKSIISKDLKFLDNPIINYSIIAVLIAVAGLLMPNLSVDKLSVFDNVFFKIFFLLLVGVVALEDPVISLLLAIIFIIAVQRLHNQKINNELNKKLMNDEDIDDLPELELNDDETEQMISETEPVQLLEVPVNDVMDVNDQVVGDCNPQSMAAFTTDDQFLSTQSNIIPNSSYMSQIKTFENQFGTQGLEDEIQGYNLSNNHFLATKSAF